MRQSGFALILIVVILVLMLLLCTTYMRVIRLRAVPIREQDANPDVALTSVIDLILQTTGKDKPIPDANPANIQEPYDHPWTDTGRTSAWGSLSYPLELTNQTAAGDPLLDDAWLADAMPDPASQRWTHLTNLRGSFLDYVEADLANSPVNPLTGKRVPSDALSSGAECPAGGIALDDKRLVDADGDGIGDSLWFYPPISHVGTTRFVAAVYIEDLSAKINLNTAFPQRNGGNYGTNGLSPLGLSPCDVDAYALCAKVANGGFGCPETDLQNVVQFRTGAAAYPLAVDWDAPGAQHRRANVAAPRTLDGGPANNADKRWNLWLFNAARSGNDGNPLDPDTRTGIWPGAHKYGLDNEVELRFRGGLNNAKTTADIKSTALGMGNSFRQGADEKSAAYAGNPWGLAAGSPRIADSNSASALMGYFTTNPRRWTTVVGGDCGLATGLPHFVSKNAGNPWYWSAWNISNAGRGAWASWDVPSGYYFQETLAQCFTGKDPANTADDVNMPPGFVETLRTTQTDAKQHPGLAASQMAANLADYADENNHITGIRGIHGMEALPFIREVYGQRKYAYAAGTYTATNASGDDTAWAVEIVNPFNRPIKLTDVWLRMKNSRNAWDGGSQTGTYVVGELAQLAASASGLATITDSDSSTHLALPAGHRLVLVRNPKDSTLGIDLSTLVSAGATTHVCVLSDTGAHTLWPSGIGKTNPGATHLNQGDATFELCARRDDGSDYNMVPKSSFTAAIGTSPSGAPAPKPAPGSGVYMWDNAYCAVCVPHLPDTYAKAAGAGGWRKVDARAPANLNVMQYRPTDYAVTGTEPDGATFLAGGVLKTELGAATPTAGLPANAADWAGDTERMYLNNNPITGRGPDRGALDHATELLDIPMVGPHLAHDDNYRKKWGGAANLRKDTDQTTAAIHENSYADALRVALTTDGTTPWANPGKSGRDGHLDALTLRTDDKPGATAADSIRFVDMSASPNPNDRVPHAIQLLRWLSPIAKASDWVDQNYSASFTGRGLDADKNKEISKNEADTAESFIPGRLNLNTAPLHVLRQALPLPSNLQRDEYAQLIVSRRKDPTAALAVAGKNIPAKSTRGGTAKGLAYTGELLTDAATATPPLAKPDFVRWLEEMTTTRSDVFAAHILVQGYADDDFASGPVSVKRMLIIVERASVNTPGGKAKVLASYSY